MNSVFDFYTKGLINELYIALKRTITSNEDTNTKIDGKPAILLWNKYKGLNDCGVGFKSLLTQLPKGTPKDYFTSNEQIDKYIETRDPNDIHRSDSFKYGLKYISPYIKDGYMVWGDVLFTPNELINNTCTPNTITYIFNDRVFPNIKDKEFGIFLHTIVNPNLTTRPFTKDILTKDIDDIFILTPEDIKPKNINESNDLLSRLDNLYNISMDNIKLLKDNDFLSVLRKHFKDIKTTSELSNIPIEQVKEITDNLLGYLELTEDIIKNKGISGIKAKIGDNPSNGEGYVVNIKGQPPLKLVSHDNFTVYNKQHMSERIDNTGENIIAWSSSKSNDLFDHYLNNDLLYGINGGSNYGFATYLVTEPPYSTDAKIGYSDEYRKKLYGNNIYEFEIPIDRVIIFTYEDFKKTKIGSDPNINFDNFIPYQVKRLGLDFTDEEIDNITPKDINAITAGEAINLYKICSRHYYQGHRGNLRTPIDGFQYQGKNDGKTLIIYNSNRLIPRRYSNDFGQTWTDFNRNSEIFKDYLIKANRMDYKYHQNDYENKIFDGNKTPLKEEAYRLLMAYNSNDGFDNNGQPLRMSDGILYNIVIYDNNTIDATFKSNLPYVDHYKHYFRIRGSNQFLNKLADLGFVFNNMVAGIKLGSETGESLGIEDLSYKLFPLKVTEGLKLVNLTLNKNSIDLIPTTFGKNTLDLVACNITEDIFDNWDVTLSQSKPSWVSSPELKQQLIEKYDWAQNLLDEKPSRKKR